MLILALSDTPGIAYELPSYTGGMPLCPMPPMAAAQLLVDWDGATPPTLPTSVRETKFLFREDHFDPVTRLRRGRLYGPANETRPKTIPVHKHPAMMDYGLGDAAQGTINMALHHFQPYFLSHIVFKANPRPLLAIGGGNAYTLWQIELVERNCGEQELLTLRLRSTLGPLPEVLPEKLPAQYREKVLETLQKVQDSLFRAGPESVIDRCRDAASAILTAHLQPSDHPDLSDLANRLATQKPVRNIVINSARNIALLHARAKPNEQERHGLRPLRESDADLALQSLTLILRDLELVR